MNLMKGGKADVAFVVDPDVDRLAMICAVSYTHLDVYKRQADNNCLWISTHLGINRLSQDSRQVVGYYDFTDDYYLPVSYTHLDNRQDAGAGFMQITGCYADYKTIMKKEDLRIVYMGTPDFAVEDVYKRQEYSKKVPMNGQKNDLHKKRLLSKG